MKPRAQKKCADSFGQFRPGVLCFNRLYHIIKGAKTYNCAPAFEYVFLHNLCLGCLYNLRGFNAFSAFIFTFKCYK